MPSALTVTFTVWDTANNAPRTGDAANLTMRIIKDGGAPANATNSPTEKENGEYALALTATERDAEFLTIEGSSSTSDTVVFPLHIVMRPLADEATYIWSTYASRTLTSATSAASITTAGCTVTVTIDNTPYDQVSGKIKLDENTAPKITFTIYDDGSVRDVSGYTFTFAGYDADGTELFSIADADFDKTDAASGIVWVRLATTDLVTAVASGRFELKMTDVDENERPVKGVLEIVASNMS